MVITVVNDDEQVTRRRVGEVSDASNDTVANELMLNLHRDPVPNKNLGFASVLTSRDVLAVGGECYGKDVVRVVALEVPLGVGLWIVHDAHSCGEIGHCVVFEV